jgi:hypothetical protein
MLYRNFTKRAGALEESAATAVYSAIPVVGIANTAGLIHGLASPTPSVNDEADMNATTTTGLLPGVSASRVIRRLKRQNRNRAGSSPRAISTVLAPLIHGAIGLVGGGIIGGALGALKPVDRVNGMDGMPDKSFEDHQRNMNTVMGAGIGMQVGMLGLGAASLLSAGLAAATPTRTREEQEEAANESPVADYLIPGYAGYNYWKSMGRSMADESDITSPSLRPKPQEPITISFNK